MAVEILASRPDRLQDRHAGHTKSGMKPSSCTRYANASRSVAFPNGLVFHERVPMAVVCIDEAHVLFLAPRVFRSGVIDFRIIVPEERKVSVELFDAKMKQALVSEIILPQET